jgi:solute carrier family 25 phosphate transporter 23/24/25/41
MVSVLNFRSFYYIRQKIIQESNPEGSELAFKQGLSNITTFAFCELFAYPVERARTLVSCDLALKGELRQYSGAYDFLQKTMNRAGIKGYYSGFSLYLLNYSLYLWIGYNLNETIHEIYKEEPAGRVLAGSLFMAKCLTYPFEVLRRRRQISDGVNYKVEPNGVHLQVGNILKTEGFKGFFRGFLPSSMLSLISLSAVVSVTEAFTQVSKE